MESKKFNLNGKEILTFCEPIQRGLGYLLRAECEGVVREHSLTIGPSEGAGPEHYDQAMLQRDLDAARAKVAAEAEWHARVRKMIDLAT